MKKKIKNVYTEFVSNGKEVFPKDMYFIRRFIFERKKYLLKL